MNAKERKLKRKRDMQQSYLKDFGSKVKRGDVPTYAQYLQMSETERGMAKSGIGYRKIQKMK